jgi:hypothetical protein
MQQEEGHKIYPIGVKLKEQEDRPYQNFLAHFKHNKVISLNTDCGSRKTDDRV